MSSCGRRGSDGTQPAAQEALLMWSREQDRNPVWGPCRRHRPSSGTAQACRTRSQPVTLSREAVSAGRVLIYPGSAAVLLRDPEKSLPFLSPCCETEGLSPPV